MVEIGILPIVLIIIVAVVVTAVIVKRKEILSLLLEGDEVKSISEEKEEVLKPEKRGFFTILWAFARFPIGAAIIGFLIALILLLMLKWEIFWAILGAVIWALIIAIIVSVLVVKWIIEISSDPPFVGGVLLFGRLTEWIAPSGYFLTIPGILDIIPIDTRRGDQDFEAQNLVTKDNATVKVLGHASYQVDVKRLPEFIRSGKLEFKDGKLVTTKGIPLIVDNMFLQYQRIEVNKLKLKPEEGEEGVLGASKTLTDGISQHFTGNEDFDLSEMNKNGRSDEKGLGIVMFVLNVTSIEPDGETKKAMESVVQEKYQRDAEVFEVVTRGKQVIAKMFIRKGVDITKLEPEEITTHLKEISEKNTKFVEEFDDFFETLFEWQLAKEKPGVIIPGMRKRLATQGGSIPLDVIGAALVELFKKPKEKE